MIATIIPFFLLAGLPEETTWDKSPEFKFTYSGDFSVEGINGSMIYGMNSTNELTCRLKNEITLNCHLKHVHVIAHELNTETGAMKSAYLQNNLFDPFQFEVEFDNKGVRKLVMNKKENKERRSELTANVINLLNVGVDLSKLKFTDGAPAKVHKMDNFLSGECETDLEVKYNDLTDDAQQEGNWNLDLVPPLEKLSNRRFDVLKFRNMSHCTSFKQFFWFELIIMDVLDEETLKYMKYDGEMSVQRDKFVSKTKINITRMDNGKEFTVLEIDSLTLDGINPVETELVEIIDPVTIVFNYTEDTSD